jgi:hypothetical protein
VYRLIRLECEEEERSIKITVTKKDVGNRARDGEVTCRNLASVRAWKITESKLGIADSTCFLRTYIDRQHLYAVLEHLVCHGGSVVEDANVRDNHNGKLCKEDTTKGIHKGHGNVLELAIEAVTVE